jgi:hypothetical protein
MVVAALIQASKIEPDIEDVEVDSNHTRVSVESVTVLIDWEIKHANGTPELEGRIATISVDSLLVSFVSLVVFYVGTTKKVPWASDGSASRDSGRRIRLDGKANLVAEGFWHVEDWRQRCIQKHPLRGDGSVVVQKCARSGTRCWH